MSVEKPENFLKNINNINRQINKNKISKITSYCQRYFSEPDLKKIINLIND